MNVSRESRTGSSRKGRGWFPRVLVHALALFIVPVLIVTTPGTAQAATKRGPDSPASWAALDSWTHKYACNARAYWEVTNGTATIVARGSCAQTFAVELDVWKMESIVFVGDTCEATAPGVDDPESSWTQVATMTSGTQACQIHAAYVQDCSHRWLDATCKTTAVDWSIAPPTEATGTCPAATFGQPRWAETASDGQSISNWWDLAVRTSYVPKPYTGPTLGDVRIHVYTEDTRTGTPVKGWLWPGGGSTPKTATNDGPDKKGLDSFIRVSSYGAHTKYRVIGVQISYQNSPVTGANVTQVPGGVQYGTSRPEHCWFYFGEKILDIAGDTDNPTGPITEVGNEADDPVPTTPVEPPGGEDPAASCDFSWSDPSTWLAGGMCRAVELLIRAVEALTGLLDLVAGLAAAIASAVTDLIQTLFIPDPASWGWDDLQTQWENRGPGQTVTELGDGITSVGDGYNGSSGCGVMADFTSEDIDAPITCSAIRDTPGMAALYTLVQAGLIALTCLGLYHLVVGSLGKGG